MKKRLCRILLLLWSVCTQAQTPFPLLVLKPSTRATYRGDILYLTGWNMVGSESPGRSAFFDSATALGYRIIIPEPGKTIYARACYPETRADYRSRLLLGWFTDTLIPHLRYNLDAFKPGYQHLVLGISTGARGAMLIAETLPQTFSYAVGISGDYNPCLNPTDALTINHYGTYQDFPIRWQTHDNPTHGLGSLRSKVILYHGTHDPVVDVRQSKAFADALQQRCAQTSNPWCQQPFLLHLLENQGHDWKAWNQALLHLLNHVLRVP